MHCGTNLHYTFYRDGNNHTNTTEHMKQLCPCHSGQPYKACCQPLHLGQPSANAERLMRSRYSAYAFKMADYLRNSWHTSTRPNDLSQADLQGIKWLGLEVIKSQTIDAQHATVTFKARFRSSQQKTQTLHETSQFVLENGQWFYVDGLIKSGEIHSE
jgi:SEC-C motif domain protein